MVGPVYHLDRVAGLDLAGPHDLEVGPRPGVGSEQLHPALLPHPAPERRARDPRGGHRQLDLRSDPPALAHQGIGQVDPRGGQVLPEEAVRQLPVEPCGPPVEVLALVRVHRLVGTAVVPAVAEEVADQPAAQTAPLGAGVADLNRTGRRLLADAGALGLLVGVRLGPTEVTDRSTATGSGYASGSARRKAITSRTNSRANGNAWPRSA